LQQLPRAGFVYSDGNAAYGELMARQRKGVQTNRIESFNSQLRQYCGYLRRKTKAYAKNEIHLQQDLCLILNDLNGF
jgi:IS1 family transposase